MPSRVKMCSKARFTVVVPAPDEPVTATTGCCLDMLSPLHSDFLDLVSDEESTAGKMHTAATATAAPAP